MLFADLLLEFLIRILVNLFLRIRRHSWPVISGTIDGASLDRGFTGLTIAEVHYFYSIDGKEFDGYFKTPFWSKNDANDYLRQFPAESTTAVRVKPGCPFKLFLVDG